jgi:hypothetical protein
MPIARLINLHTKRTPLGPNRVKNATIAANVRLETNRASENGAAAVGHSGGEVVRAARSRLVVNAGPGKLSVKRMCFSGTTARRSKYRQLQRICP